eukprot:1076623-Pyramimonas_sp.AAC.1
MLAKAKAKAKQSKVKAADTTDSKSAVAAASAAAARAEELGEDCPALDGEEDLVTAPAPWGRPRLRPKARPRPRRFLKLPRTSTGLPTEQASAHLVRGQRLPLPCPMRSALPCPLWAL